MLDIFLKKKKKKVRYHADDYKKNQQTEIKFNHKDFFFVWATCKKIMCH